MSYVDAAYTICLGVLAAYAAGLVMRRRRLRAAVTAMGPATEGDGSRGDRDGGVTG
jgi:hypothetical protein